MWEKLRVVWQIPELRQKILLTLLMLAVYRIGFQIQLPVIDQAAVSQFGSKRAAWPTCCRPWRSSVPRQLDQVTIFGLGIMPYISASIIFQLLGSVYPPLEQLQKEGEAGRKKINEYTRYATVFLCLFQSYFYLRSFIIPQGFVLPAFQNADGGMLWSWQMISIFTMTAGTVFLMWLGEQIDEFGIGNGISLLIMAGILARMPGAGWQLLQQASLELGGGSSGLGIEGLLLLACMFVAVVMGVVYITLGQRRIPMQSAKHVRGRRVYGGTRQYLPLKVNQAGVMPIIFASSLLMFPLLILTNLQNVRLERRLLGKTSSIGPIEVFHRGRIHLQHPVPGDDLLLLLLLDGDHLQSEGHGRESQELWVVYSGLSAREADRRLPRKSDGSDHVRWGRIPGGRGDHSHADIHATQRKLGDCQFLRRDEFTDCRKCGIRPSAKDR